MNIFLVLVAAWVSAMLVATWTPPQPRIRRRKTRPAARSVESPPMEQPGETVQASVLIAR